MEVKMNLKLLNAIKMSDQRAWKIARQANITPQRLSALVTGNYTKPATSEEQSRISKVLGISVSAIFPKVGPL
jgi:hypothetical protein